MLIFRAEWCKSNVMCKIAVLERFTLFGTGIQSIIREDNKCEIVILAETVDTLIKALEQEKPDVIVFDILHGENSGIKTLKKIRRNYPKVPVLLIVSQFYSEYFEEYIRMGVKGFVFNVSKSEELVKAIKKLEKGEEYFSQQAWELFKASIQASKYKKREQQRLSDREIAVLKLFTRGMSYKEIGVSLNISPRTVETHKRNILSKLKISSTADMVKYALLNHILP